MRALAIAALVLGGCSQILGIQDPVGLGDDVGLDGASCSAPDAAPGPDAAAACDVFDPSTCGTGEACDGFPQLGCRAEGTAGPLETCAGPTDCAGGEICNQGMCREYCHTDCDCTNGETYCIFEGFAGRFCGEDCDFTSTGDGGCGTGRECVINSYYGVKTGLVCVTSPDGGNLAPGASCTQLYDCQAGYHCDLWGGGNSTCTRLCVVGGPSVCTGGTSCVTLHDENQGAAMFARGVPIGVCR